MTTLSAIPPSQRLSWTLAVAFLLLGLAFWIPHDVSVPTLAVDADRPSAVSCTAPLDADSRRRCGHVLGLADYPTALLTTHPMRRP